ncbi:MAG TPA: hypothetical protein VF519_13180 [Mycobacteriales bacterium]
MHDTSRRTLLRAAVFGAVTVAVPGVAAGRASALSVASSPTRLRRRVFVPHVGTSFLLTSGRATYRAILTEVSDSTRAAGHDRRFGLTFRIAGAARPADGTYAVTHPHLRAFDLYVGAVGKPERGLYEAVVNA